MFTKSPLGLAIAALIAAPISAQAEVTVSAVLKNETAFLVDDGPTHNEKSSMLDESLRDSGHHIKNENSARIFINGDVGEDSTWHVELRPVYDFEGVNENYRGHELYSQNDWFREGYVDTEALGWDLRLGKQQVVWGTADGIKLLDIINPTDFSELNQNAVEDARIPIFMANAERYFDNGNLQLIVSDSRENRIPGLNPDGDRRQVFIMQGVDSITGTVNGFYNVAPALSNVAASFQAAALGGAFAWTGAPAAAGLTPFGGLTVDAFSNGTWNSAGGAITPDPTGAPGFILLNGITQNGLFAGDPNGNDNVTNLMPISGAAPTDVTWAPSKASSAFEYMPNATYATFNSFTSFDPSKPTGFGGIRTEWKRDYSDDPNFGGRFRSSLDNGLNFSVNYFYHYSANPAIDLSWRNSSGQELSVQRAPANFAAGGAPDLSQNLTRDQAKAAWDQGIPTTILLRDQAGNYYGAVDPSTGAFNDPSRSATLRFTEYSDRVHSLGASFDYAFEAADTPVVVRGEFLYDKDEKQPIVDKYLLSTGDLTNALKMEDADYFKYVIGVDVTVLTNLLVSGQFIQFRNLDYEDDSDRCVTQGSITTAPGTGRTSIDCSRYTADFSTLSMNNGFNKAEENKEFYSLFLSKPFGPNQLGRVNNIIIYEEGDGWWNRLDAEYTLTDQLIVGGELNMYWGDEDTTFGQFENSSNVQFTVKYIIE